jgi:acyl-coenzyme A synthetase/AMP-(fatty) acid ligase
MNPLSELARSALDGAPDAEAVEYLGRWHAWHEFRTVAGQLASLLDASGADPRAPIAFVPRNRPSAIAAELGMIAARRTIRMIYAFQSPAGIARDAGRSHVSAIVAAAEDFTPELMAVLRAQGLAGIALGEMVAEAVVGAERCTALLDPNAPAEPQLQVHTSGTTGAPKHVGFSYEMVAKYIVGQNVSTVAGEQGAATPVLLTFPLGNISGIYSVLPTLLQRRRAVLLDRFTLDGWRDFVRRFQPAMPGLPPGAVGMVLDAGIPPEELACVKMIMTGAAPLDPSIQHAFEARYGIPILLSYGATEFGGPVTAMTPELYTQYGAAKLGTVGRPFAGAQLRAIDAETGAELPPGQEGLLEVSAPRIGAHWIRTTDIGVVDADGFIFLRGRADGAIMRGGLKLLPEAIERALCLHPKVAAAAVVGIADKRLGQVPAAAVQLKFGMAAPAIAELENHLRQHVYATHIPTEWRFVAALPRNNSFKISLPDVKALFAPQEGVFHS